ncbi:hypothetical protein L249_5438, partial [Ophiocordyceps polyrhachis-furcata BCC 54312]
KSPIFRGYKKTQKVIQAVDKELTNREGDHVIEKKKRNHVGKPSFFYRQFLRNKGTYPTPL